MVAHLTDAEKDLVDRITRHKKGSVTEALEAVNKRRVKKGEEPVTRSPVYRYVSGGTHTRKSEETRDRPKVVTKAMVAKLQQGRRRLCKKADSEQRVTHEDVQEGAGLAGVFCSKTLADALRKSGVRYKNPRKKIGLALQGLCMPLPRLQQNVHKLQLVQ